MENRWGMYKSMVLPALNIIFLKRVTYFTLDVQNTQIDCKIHLYFYDFEVSQTCESRNYTLYPVQHIDEFYFI